MPFKALAYAMARAVRPIRRFPDMVNKVRKVVGRNTDRSTDWTGWMAGAGIVAEYTLGGS